MKIKPEHLELMRQSITPHDTPFRRERYKAAGLSDKRYRWDLFFYAEKKRNPNQPDSQWVCDVLYTYLNDNHIDTALRSIVKPLEN